MCCTRIGKLMFPALCRCYRIGVGGLWRSGRAPSEYEYSGMGDHSGTPLQGPHYDTTSRHHCALHLNLVLHTLVVRMQLADANCTLASPTRPSRTGLGEGAHAVERRAREASGRPANVGATDGGTFVDGDGQRVGAAAAVGACTGIPSITHHRPSAWHRRYGHPKVKTNGLGWPMR